MPSPPPHQEETDEQIAGTVGIKANSRITAPIGGRQIKKNGADIGTKDFRETHGNQRVSE
jgi:hypothetical protein